jgi:Mrp family chromosome partitioning ATPase
MIRWSGQLAGGKRVIDPAFSNERWQGDSDAAGGVGRPGVVASLLRYWEVVVAATVLGAVVGYGVAQQGPVRYQADAVLIVSDPGGPSVVGGGDALDSGDREVYLAKQAEIMTSSVVLERAVELLGGGQSVGEVRGALDAQPSADLASISIVATGADPESAAALANAVGTAYEQVSEERVAADAQRAIASLETLRDRFQTNLDASPRSSDGQLSSRQQQLAGQIADIEQRQLDITAQAEVYASGVEYFERAEPPASPSQPKPMMGAVLGGLAGVLAAGAWAWRAAARDQRAEGRDEPARILGAPLLGEVPRPRVPPVGSLVTAPGLDPALDDAYHLVVASIEHELAAVGGNSIAVTSVGHGASRTSTVLQIATAAWGQNRTILLIDADVRLRRLSQRVGAAPVGSEGNGHKPALPDGESAGIKEHIDRLVSTDSGMVLPIVPDPADPWHPAGSSRAVEVGDTVRSIGEMFDLVLIDTPALLSSSDSLGIAGLADGVILVVAHRVALSRLRDVRDRLAFVKTPLIGYVYVRPPTNRAHTLWHQVTGMRHRTPTGRR